MKNNVYLEKTIEGPGSVCHMCGRTVKTLIRLVETDGKVFKYCERCAKDLALLDPPYSYR
jgi:ribosome-binding protein aMBF1 (putative translation factor)